MARWVEITTDDNREASAAVLAAVGQPLKTDEAYRLWEALSDAGFAIHADIKDDDSVAAAIEAMSAALGLGPFTAPPDPPAGIDRCIALLRAWDAALAARHYRLVAIDNDQDGWTAVAVRGDRFETLRAVAAALSIPLAEPAALYGF